jgi:hypothetical protein
MKKQAQDDDFGGDQDPYPEPYEGSDLENWENEQVFRDQSAERDEQNEEEGLLTNTGDPALTADQLSIMDSKEFAENILNWHGGGGSGIYSVGSTLLAGHEPDPMEIKRAINELEKDTASPHGYTDGDKMEMSNFANELRNRFPEENDDPYAPEDMIDDPYATEDNDDDDRFHQMANWVRKNCKFAKNVKAMENIPLTRPDPNSGQPSGFGGEEQALREVAQRIITWAKEEEEAGRKVKSFSPTNVDQIIYDMLKRADPKHPALFDRKLRDPVTREVLTVLDAQRSSNEDPTVRY